MKHSLLALLAVLLLTPWAELRAASDSKQLAAIESADDRRIKAMKSPDRAGLEAILSEDLRYAHSTGAVDTKKSLTDSLTSGKTKYLVFEYDERNFTFPSPGIALMTGRARIKAQSATGLSENTLSYLAVWREEKGQWRFLAWQSCKLPPPTAP